MERTREHERGGAVAESGSRCRTFKE